MTKQEAIYKLKALLYEATNDKNEARFEIDAVYYEAAGEESAYKYALNLVERLEDVK